MSTLFATLLYNAPWLVALYRKRQGKNIVVPFGLLFVMNFFMGWTIIGWLLPMANALGYNPLPFVVAPLAKLLVTYGNTGPGGGPASGPSGQAGPGACGSCGGSGSTMCSSCGGRGSWYDAPTTAAGSAQLRNCGACTSSGRLRCMSCGGSGRAPAII